MCAMAASAYPMCMRLRQVSCPSPSTYVRCPNQYVRIFSGVSRVLPGGVLGSGPSEVR
ncbi:hypothetical protein SCALM49S_02407 [Streptomyces californicus]